VPGETVLWKGLLSLKPFFNHNGPIIRASQVESVQNMLWKRIKRRIVAATGPSLWPVPAGLAMGAAILLVVSLAQATTPNFRIADSTDNVSRFKGLQEFATAAGARRRPAMPARDCYCCPGPRRLILHGG
jgi:hypothetical protein